MDSPAWVSKKLFETALQQFLNTNDVKIIDYTGNTFSSIAETFCSSLFRTTITYKSQENNNNVDKIAVLVKRSPETKEALRFTEELNYFKKEIEMFQTTLEEFHKILGTIGTISARCLYAQIKPFPLLVLEDLAPMGFTMLNSRREGLDLEHCLCVVKKLAQFHAASLVYESKNPTAYKSYSESMFWGKPIVLEWIQLSTDALLNVCRKYTDLQKYADKLQHIKGKVAERASAAAKFSSGDFTVLNHGDPWINNFLFSYDQEGKVKDVRLVDYQVVAYGSPAIDLHYLWATSPTPSVRCKHLETFLQYYYRNLTENLNELQFKPKNLPSYEELKRDWIARVYYGFVSAVTVLPLIKCDKRQDATLDGLLERYNDSEDSFRHHVFNNSIALEHIRSALPFYEALGIFE